MLLECCGEALDPARTWTGERLDSPHWEAKATLRTSADRGLRAACGSPRTLGLKAAGISLQGPSSCPKTTSLTHTHRHTHPSQPKRAAGPRLPRIRSSHQTQNASSTQNGRVSGLFPVPGLAGRGEQAPSRWRLCSLPTHTPTCTCTPSNSHDATLRTWQPPPTHPPGPTRGGWPLPGPGWAWTTADPPPRLWICRGHLLP